MSRIDFIKTDVILSKHGETVDIGSLVVFKNGAVFEGDLLKLPPFVKITEIVSKENINLTSDQTITFNADKVSIEAPGGISINGRSLEPVWGFWEFEGCGPGPLKDYKSRGPISKMLSLGIYSITINLNFPERIESQLRILVGDICQVTIPIKGKKVNSSVIIEVVADGDLIFELTEASPVSGTSSIIKMN